MLCLNQPVFMEEDGMVDSTKKPPVWIDEPDLGRWAVQRECEREKSYLKPSLEDVQSVFFGGNTLLRSFPARGKKKFVVVIVETIDD